MIGRYSIISSNIVVLYALMNIPVWNLRSMGCLAP
jgi:hypothetical protein